MTDPTFEIRMQVMWNRLISVVEEQAMTLLRTAFSTSVREAGDLSAGVFDPQGRMLAQATFEGAAAMATQSPLHPSELRAQVTSKGGTTAAAVAVLDAHGVQAAFVAALKFCAVYTLITWLLMALLSGPIVSSFGLTGDGAEVVRIFTHWAAGAFVFTGALFVANATFNNLGRPLASTAANWFRDGILILPLAVVIGAQLGATGVVWANSLANIIAGCLAAILAWRHIRTLLRPAVIAA